MSKKSDRNLNHLLNFWREEVHRHTNPRTTYAHDSRRNGASPSVPFSRENFVKANFCFALDHKTNSQAIRGKDKLEWNDIQSVVIKSEGLLQCPICLDHLKVPRMTTCGHCFCSVCISRFFIHAQDTWERCPLCAALFRESETKRVAEIEYFSSLKPRTKTNFVLLKRKRSSVVPVLASELMSYCKVEFPQFGSSKYCRIFIETGLHSETTASRELEILASEYFVNPLFPDFLERELVEKLQQDICLMGHDSIPCQTAEVDNKLVDDEDVYFYQLEDSRLYFLDPFNIKCLVHEYGPERNLHPLNLSEVMILVVEPVTITPELAKRHSFLMHLPLHANIAFVEVDLSKYLSPGTKEHLKEEFKQRSQKRQARKKAEHRHEKAIESRKMENSNSSFFYEYTEIEARSRKSAGKIEEELSHAFDVSLSSEPAPPSQPTMWENNTIGSFATVVNSKDHFPELGSNSKKTEPPLIINTWAKPPTQPKPQRNKKGKKVLLFGN